MGTSQTSSATDVVLKVQQGLQDMNPEKKLANPPGQHFWQEGNTLCLPDHPPPQLQPQKRDEIRAGLILVEPFSFPIQQPTYGRVAHKKLVTCQ